MIVWNPEVKERRQAYVADGIASGETQVAFTSDGTGLACCAERSVKLIGAPSATGEISDGTGILKQTFGGQAGHGDQTS